MFFNIGHFFSIDLYLLPTVDFRDSVQFCTVYGVFPSADFYVARYDEGVLSVLVYVPVWAHLVLE